MNMSIANVVQRGMLIYVYDERGHTLTTLSGSTRPGEGLKSFTSSTVNVQRGGLIYTYDQKGRQVSVTAAGR